VEGGGEYAGKGIAKAESQSYATARKRREKEKVLIRENPGGRKRDHRPLKTWGG